MKKNFHLFIILNCFWLSVSCDSAQVIREPEWHSLSNIPDSESRYDDVFFLNENLGWAADGVGGKVFKTVDGGKNWTEQLHLPSHYLRNIEFLDENIGFLGTLSGDFYRTSDGGQNWQTVSNIPGTIHAICGLDAVGENTIYGCGAYFSPAYIIKSSDKGLTWQFIDMSTYARSLVEVLFVNENVGFASGSDFSGGVILKTVNGGATWIKLFNTDVIGEYVWKLQILQSNRNVMFASVESVAPRNGKLLKSFDAGMNWVSSEVPDTDIQAVGFVSESHGWMGGHHSGFLETFDGGQTWNNTQFGDNLNRIQFINENLAYCSGASIYKFSTDNNVGNKKPHIAVPKQKYLKVITAAEINGQQLEISVNYDSGNHIIMELFDSKGNFLKTLIREKITKAEIKNYNFSFPYPAGIYYINLHDDKGGQSEKIIKK